jgi:hypothetical protein
MARFLPFVSLLYIGIMVWAIADILLIDSSRVRGLPKFAWVTLVILLPLIGSILWVAIGRERSEPRSHGRYADRPMGVTTGRSLSPDDDPAFLERLNLDRQQEQRIRELERRLAELDGDDSAKKG